MRESKQGMVQIFFGNGKGKTTAALGAALRACGYEFKVHLVQFLKNGVKDNDKEYPGEIRSLEKLKNFSFKRFGAGTWVKGKPTIEDIKEVEEAYNHIIGCFLEDYDIIIADELLYAVQLKLISEEKIIFLIKNKPYDKELILTGSHIPFPNIFEHADLVTELKKIKHPFDSGIMARKGIEY